jgi:hypothetical protein
VRALGRELELAGDELEELVEELVEIQRVARQEGRALVWSGGAAQVPAPAPTPHLTAPAAERSPRDYTPKHLADRILQSKSALEGERKQVTVLFVDLQRSMELSEDIDPEEWHEIMDRFFAILADGVHRFEGTVNQYTGDGIMALFGAPLAHEDHPQRACWAAPKLRDALREYGQQLKRERGLTFTARMGIHCGEVVVCKIGRIGDSRGVRRPVSPVYDNSPGDPGREEAPIP